MKKFFTSETLFWKVMRIGTIQMIIITLACSVTIAHHSAAQLLEKKITLSGENIPFSQAIEKIEQASGVKIFYSSDQLGINDSVSINAHDQPLRTILDKLLSPHHISYRVHEEDLTIMLKKNEVIEGNNDNSMDDPLPLDPLALIRGTVTDATTNQPIAGVNIIIKSTTTGTTTDANGTYSIEADPESVLVFSFIGYKSIEAAVNQRTVIDISLTEDIASLNEVVINAGYFTVKEKEQTGNISRITSEQIKTQPVSNPLQALIGRMPGVSVVQQTGMPGGAISIQIRGKNSMLKGNDPLYIIDGVPFTSTSVNSYLFSSVVGGGSPLSNINPSEIESIEILKDADATAIYGSRGANGVVLITTKKGKSGKTKVDIDFSSGIGQVASHINLLNTPQYLSMRKEAFRNDNMIPSIDNARDLLVWDTTRYTDFQKLLIGGTAHTNNLSASLSGGNESTQFVVGTGLRKETTVFPGDFSDQKASFHTSLVNHSADKRFTIQLSTNFNIEDNTLPSHDFTSQIFALAPNSPELYKSDGSINWGPPEATFYNPMAGLRRKYTAKSSNLIGNLLLTYRLLPGLDLKASMGYNDLQMNDLRTDPKSANNPIYNSVPATYFGDNRVKTWIVEPQLNYNKEWSKSKLSITAGTTLQQTLTIGKTLYATGFTNDILIENIAAASNVQVFSSVNSTYRYAGLFARANYNFNEKYIINFTARRDGSSRFGPGKQFANFGAIGAAWVFSNESLLKNNLQSLSYGKLRASFGTTGNDQIGDYNYLDTWSPTIYPYQNVTGFFPARLFNNTYGWERNKKMEAGLETAWFSSRLTTAIAFYRNRSSSQLLGYSLPLTTGFSSVEKNLPATAQNQGWEIELGAALFQRSNFMWNASVNYTRPRNVLLHYDDLQNSTYANTFEVGKPITAYKQYHSTGVDPITGNYTFEDVNKNGSDTDYPEDLKISKVVQQNFYGGVTNTVTLHNWQLAFTFQYVKQTGYNYFYSNGIIPGFLGNQAALVLDRWQKEGDQAAVQQFTQTYGNTASRFYSYQFSDGTIGDASFIRLKNLSLSYQLKGEWLNKMRLQQCKLYIMGQNLLTFTKYQGLDPETQLNQSLPPLRTFMAGISVSL